MKQISLFRFFVVWVGLSLIAWVIMAGVIDLLSRVLAWFTTNQWVWGTFNEWIGGELLAIPIALVMAGGNTLVLWHERTDTPLKWKLVVWAIVFGILGGIGFGCVEIINTLFPH